ncbi:hypothetical protein AaE_015897 [Aphanomyces astaci]|uniref:Tc1-like transposase DDE domain-containing protein n=1 Tax=Aphanomyces astaci TaxID=112090 RepID=A0A6A4Z5H0_APHAT|nr:hypothetical protein AaE_015897 [Aphanomyces astaci]
MGRALQLSEIEQGQALAWSSEGISVREIGRRLDRNHVTISNYLKDPTSYGNNYKKGRPKKLNAQQQRRLYRTSTNETLSAAKLNDQLDLDLHKSTVARYLRSNNKFEFIKMNRAPKLTPMHMLCRKEWASEMVDYGNEKWSSVVFSDEKKWNLDGPDGLKSYWHCVGRDVKTVFSRQNGGGSLMVWGGIWADGTTQLAFVEGTQTAQDYIYTLGEFMLPAAQLRFGTDFVFQQDNASIHTANATKAFLDEQGVVVMDWPALSPDLNPIENVWGYLVQQVYAGGKQYDSKEELKASIMRHWNSLEVSYLQTLIFSMKSRCLSVVAANGMTTKY